MVTTEVEKYRGIININTVSQRESHLLTLLLPDLFLQQYRHSGNTIYSHRKCSSNTDPTERREKKLTDVPVAAVSPCQSCCSACGHILMLEVVKPLHNDVHGRAHRVLWFVFSQKWHCLMSTRQSYLTSLLLGCAGSGRLDQTYRYLTIALSILTHRTQRCKSAWQHGEASDYTANFTFRPF